MKKSECPDPEALALFALGQASGEEWRHAVRHLADCTLCRRQVALLSEDDETALPPAEPVEVGAFRARPQTWHRVAQGVAAAALIAAGVAWALFNGPLKPKTVVIRVPIAQPPAAPDRSPLPTPEAPAPLLATPEKRLPPPREPVAPDRTPVPPLPAPEIVKTPPAASPFLAERARSEVAEAIEISAGDGTVSRRSGDVVTPLTPRTMIQPSDTLISPVGGSVLLPDGSTVHLARESELRLSWSQTLACAAVDVRKGDAVVDFGKTPKPLLLAHGAIGVHLRETAGRLWVSAGEQSLRATPLSGSTQFRTRSGEPRKLEVRQSLLLGEAGDSLEPAEKADVSRFSTLEPAVRGAPQPPLAPDKRPPLLDVLLAGLGAQSYSYRVTGRQVRDGTWSPPGIYTSTIEEFTAAKRIDDEKALHLRRGSRAWDDLGKTAAGGRDARLLEILRASQAPHQMLLDLRPAFRAESAPRPEQVRDRLCVAWDIALDPRALRPFMEKILDTAVADGRLEKSDSIFWDSLEGSLEIAALKYESKILRIVDRRKIAYSCKTVTGLDRRTYRLETVYEFHSHGAAALQLPPELLKELSAPKK
jgi:hypothetical protein